MPVEIKELVVKTIIEKRNKGKIPLQEDGISPKKWEYMKKQIIQECVILMEEMIINLKER